MKKLVQNFFLCGIIGWCVEILFTALQNLRRHDFRLIGTSSLWMFPIYGCGSLLIIPYKIFHSCSFFIRGFVYMLCIFSGEYLSGRFLSAIDACPWDYEKCRLHINKVIRLDYAPLWFLLGLFIERMLLSTRKQ